jgi:hypothetical protein
MLDRSAGGNSKHVLNFDGRYPENASILVSYDGAHLPFVVSHAVKRSPGRFQNMAHKNLPRVRISQVALCAGFLCAGCSIDTRELLEQSQASGSSTASKAESGLFDLGSDLSGETPDSAMEVFVSSTDLPSPGRTNPFELSGEFHTDTGDLTNNSKREIFIVGFVEVDRKCVMLSVDGRTEVLGVGDTLAGITVLELAQPQARLSYDGVSWYASLLDRRGKQGDLSTKR